jgi:hypothetical protein
MQSSESSSENHPQILPNSLYEKDMVGSKYVKESTNLPERKWKSMRFKDNSTNDMMNDPSSSDAAASFFKSNDEASTEFYALQ